jgi:DNA-binding NtrC family response regulator
LSALEVYKGEDVMPHMNVVIVQSDPQHAESLAAVLGSRSCHVSVANSLAELRSSIEKNRINAVVVDLDVVPMTEITALSRQYGLDVVCTHRVADEKMWVDAVNAGAVDVCYPTDAHAISGALCINHQSAAA